MNDLARKCFAVFAMVFLSGSAPARADTVTMEDGRTWKGLIVAHTERDLKLDLGFDVASLEKKKIVSFKCSDAAERGRLKKELDSKRLRRDTLLSRRDGGAREAPLINEGGHVFVEATLNGHAKARLFLDTGSTVTILTPEAAARAGLSMDDAGRPIEIVTSDGRKNPTKMLTLDSLSVGGAEVRHVDVVIVKHRNGKPLYGDGLLGVSYLSRFDFKIDYRRRVLVLEPNGRAGSYFMGTA